MALRGLPSKNAKKKTAGKTQTKPAAKPAAKPADKGKLVGSGTVSRGPAVAGGTGKGNGSGKDKNKGKGQGQNKGGGGGGGGKGLDRRMFEFQKKEAERARKEENQRAKQINRGTKSINQSFKGFDKGFFDQRQAAYTGFYKPQLQDQYKKARENLTFALARAGTLNSTVAGEKSAEITRDFTTNSALIDSKALADRTAAEGRIADEKSALIAQLNSTADAKRVGNEATSRTAQLATEAPEYNPLGDIFYGAAQGIGGMAQAAQNATYMQTAGLAPKPGGVRGRTTTVF
jgi:hypothetical protein